MHHIRIFSGFSRLFFCCVAFGYTFVHATAIHHLHSFSGFSKLHVLWLPRNWPTVLMLGRCVFAGNSVDQREPMKVSRLWSPRTFTQFINVNNQSPQNDDASVASLIKASVACGESHTAFLMCARLYVVRIPYPYQSTT